MRSISFWYSAVNRLFDLQPGERIRRKDLHLKYGGVTQGGMSPSRGTPNIFLFTDSESGPQHGYRDGWNRDGLFHYTGMGQQGNQRMVMGNKALLDHKRDHRAVRLFEGSRGVVKYIGEFELDDEQPYYKTKAPSTGNGPDRTVFVFRLRPISAVAKPNSPLANEQVPAQSRRSTDNQEAGALSDKFVEALSYANAAHGSQVRRGTEIPYISHLLAVASIVLDHGGDDDEATAALLHDVPEDCGGQGMLIQIRQRFGVRVAEIVEGCSDSLATDPLAKEPWRIRKERYHDHVRQTANGSVLLVSAADKLHNASATVADLRRDGPSVWNRFKAGRDVIWNYEVLLDVYSKSGDRRARAIAAELKPVVAALAELS